MKDRMPLFSTFPGSQKAFLNFFFTSSLRSRRSILESCRKRFPQPFTHPLAQKRQLRLERLLRPQCELREKSPSPEVQPLTRPPAEPLTTAPAQGPTSSDELILLPVSPGTIGFIKWMRLA